MAVSGLLGLIVFLIVLIIFWLILQAACNAFGFPLTDPLRMLIGLLFLILFLVQFLGVLGVGSMHPILVF